MGGIVYLEHGNYQFLFYVCLCRIIQNNFCPHKTVFHLGQKFHRAKKRCQIGTISNTFPLIFQREVSHWKASNQRFCEKQPWGYIFFEGSWANFHSGLPLLGSQVEGKKNIKEFPSWPRWQIRDEVKAVFSHISWRRAGWRLKCIFLEAVM